MLLERLRFGNGMIRDDEPLADESNGRLRDRWAGGEDALGATAGAQRGRWLL